MTDQHLVVLGVVVVAGVTVFVIQMLVDLVTELVTR